MVNASLTGVNLLLLVDHSSHSHPLTSRQSQLVVSWHWRFKTKGLVSRHTNPLCEYYFVPPVAVFDMGSSPFPGFARVRAVIC